MQDETPEDAAVAPGPDGRPVPGLDPEPAVRGLRESSEVGGAPRAAERARRRWGMARPADDPAVHQLPHHGAGSAAPGLSEELGASDGDLRGDADPAAAGGLPADIPGPFEDFAMRQQGRGWTDHEGAEQRALFDWARRVRVEGAVEDRPTAAGIERAQLMLGDVLLWVPNGVAKLSPQVARKMREQGLQAGVPDLFLPLPVGRWHGLWIELKAAPGTPSQISPAQLVWLRRLQRAGYAATVARGWLEAQQAILAYLGGQWGSAEL